MRHVSLADNSPTRNIGAASVRASRVTKHVCCLRFRIAVTLVIVLRAGFQEQTRYAMGC